jgi:hypothetical protein
MSSPGSLNLAGDSPAAVDGRENKSPESKLKSGQQQTWTANQGRALGDICKDNDS